MKSDEHPFSALAPRDAHKRGLHRTMTLGGEYATRNYTVKHLQDLKGKTILTETMPFTTREAVAAEEAGDDDEAGDTVARARTSSPRRDAPPAPRGRAVRSRRPQQPSPWRADGIATPPAPLVRSDA